jgi:L-lactate utilization protein LutC
LTFFQYIESRCKEAGLPDEWGRVFAEYSVLDHTRARHNVGNVIRNAWDTESEVPQKVMHEAAQVVAKVLSRANLAEYLMPSCCESHRQRMVAFFADAKAYPENHELLLVIGQTLWIQLPEARCQVPMEAPRGS